MDVCYGLDCGGEDEEEEGEEGALVGGRGGRGECDCDCFVGEEGV